MAATFDRIRAAVRAVPRGRVTTYGEIAAQVLGATPRIVGYALAGLGEEHADVPWHRVVNAAGRISLPPGSEAHAEQRRRLEAEGVELTSSGRIDLDRFGATEPGGSP